MDLTGRRGMRITVGAHVAAPVKRVYEVYADYRRWPGMFPAIRRVRLVHRDGHAVDLAIDHVEGTVPNRQG